MNNIDINFILPRFVTNLLLAAIVLGIAMALVAFNPIVPFLRFSQEDTTFWGLMASTPFVWKALGFTWGVAEKR